MIFQLSLTLGITIIFLAFIAEYMDSTLGMGYGTSLTPILLIMDFSPLQIVPAILLSELITGLLAGFTHHSIGNVDFRPKTMNIIKIYYSIKKIGIINSFKKGIPLHLKVVLCIAICSIIGTIISVSVAVSIPKLYLKIYIGILILAIGIIILITLNKNYPFSWKKIFLLGTIASFNKGLSGGGYGPVVTGGQLVSGVDGKNAVGITSLAEGLTCIIGFASYFFYNKINSLQLAPYLIIGAILSVPLSAISVRKINTIKLKIIIGIIVTFLGIITLLKIFL